MFAPHAVDNDPRVSGLSRLVMACASSRPAVAGANGRRRGRTEHFQKPPRHRFAWPRGIPPHQHPRLIRGGQLDQRVARAARLRSARVLVDGVAPLKISLLMDASYRYSRSPLATRQPPASPGRAPRSSSSSTSANRSSAPEPAAAVEANSACHRVVHRGQQLAIAAGHVAHRRRRMFGELFLYQAVDSPTLSPMPRRRPIRDDRSRRVGKRIRPQGRQCLPGAKHGVVGSGCSMASIHRSTTTWRISPRCLGQRPSRRRPAGHRLDQVLGRMRSERLAQRRVLLALVIVERQLAGPAALEGRGRRSAVGRSTSGEHDRSVASWRRRRTASSSRPSGSGRTCGRGSGRRRPSGPAGRASRRRCGRR